MILLKRIFVFATICSCIYGCKIKSNSPNDFSVRVDNLCNLKNTNSNLDCIEYLQLETFVEMLFTEDGIRFSGFVADEDIQNSLSERDDLLYTESCFEMFLDPYADGKNYYEIEINPLEAIFDYMLRDAEGPLNTDENMVQWTIPQENLVITVMGTINDSSDTDDGWSFTMYVPWKIINDGPIKAGDCIAYNFMRVDADGDVASYWVARPTGKPLIHLPQVWPKICF
jgi:hypothetical protein